MPASTFGTFYLTIVDDVIFVTYFISLQSVVDMLANLKKKPCFQTRQVVA